MTKQTEALKLALEALEKLWNIIDDIDTYGDMAKDDEKLYRSLVERRQRTRFEETGITTDGYGLSGGAITAIKEALAQPEQEPDDLTIAYMAGFSRGKDAAPQRKPLAYVDLRRIANQCGLGANEVSARTQATVDNFARAIEAAHGIKE